MCHVLIIEDDWLISQFVGELATQAGATSLAYAITEKEAVAAALETTPAVVISDVNLAEGTGPSAVKLIENNLGPIPVIYVTASPDGLEQSKSVVAVLLKPIKPEVLVATLGTIATGPSA